MKSLFVFLAASLLIITSCGGGNKSSDSNAVTITISPTAVTLNQGQTSQFTATVTNSSNTTVTWQVNGVAGGSATTGTISSSGLYTAPASVTTGGTVNVTAVSQADTTKTATATVTLNPTVVAPTSPILVSPTQATLPAGAQQSFTGTVNGASANVTWSVSCQSTTASDCGTISSTGVYTAPFFPPPGGGAIVTATSTDNTALPGNAPVAIQISNQSIFGQYAFSITGKNGSSFTAAAGSISFDGQGNVTGGVEDILGNGSSPLTITGGSYHIGSDGRGNVTVQAGGNTFKWQVVLLSHSQAYFTTFDSANVGLGTLDLQDSSQFTLGAFQGAYSMKLTGASGANPSGRLSGAGAFTADGAGAISSGLMDLNDTGTPSTSLALTGTYTAPSNRGRGTLTLSSSFGSQSFVYYIANSTRVRLLETDGSNSSVVELRRQAAGPFTNGSFHGKYVTAVSGASNTGPVATGGLLTVDGVGAFTATIDINNNGNLQSAQAVTGTYSVTDGATGRTAMTWNESDGAHQFVSYPSQNGELILLQLDAVSAVGPALPQPTSGNFSRTFTGNFAAFASGVSFTGNAGPEAFVGQLKPNGGSSISGVLEVNGNGTLTPSSSFNGSYTIDSAGRGTVNATSSSSVLSTASFVFYVADDNRALFIEFDSDRVMTGALQEQ